MDLTPADLMNPCDYGVTGESDEGQSNWNFWEADYQPTDNIDDIPSSSD